MLTFLQFAATLLLLAFAFGCLAYLCKKWVEAKKLFLDSEANNV